MRTTAWSCKLVPSIFSNGYLLLSLELCDRCRFALKIQETDPTELKPVFSDGGINYVYIQVRSLRILTFGTAQCYRALLA